MIADKRVAGDMGRVSAPFFMPLVMSRKGESGIPTAARPIIRDESLYARKAARPQPISQEDS